MSSITARVCPPNIKAAAAKLFLIIWNMTREKPIHCANYTAPQSKKKKKVAAIFKVSVYFLNMYKSKKLS